MAEPNGEIPPPPAPEPHPVLEPPAAPVHEPPVRNESQRMEQERRIQTFRGFRNEALQSTINDRLRESKLGENWLGLRRAPEIRERVSWWKRMFLRVPFIAGLAPNRLAEMAPQIHSDLRTTQQVGSALLGGGNLLSPTVQAVAASAVNASLYGAAFSAGLRGVVDGIRVATAKGTRHVELLTREWTWRSQIGDKKGAREFTTIFEEHRSDVTSLAERMREWEQQGYTDDQIKTEVQNMVQSDGDGEIRRQLKTVFALHLDAEKLKRRLPLEQQEKMRPQEERFFANLNKAVGAADRLFTHGLTDRQKVEFLQNELPAYEKWRVAEKTTKMMIGRMGRALVSGGIAGLAINLGKNLLQTGMIQSLWNKIPLTDEKAQAQAAQAVGGKIVDGAAWVGQRVNEAVAFTKNVVGGAIDKATAPTTP